MLLNYVFIFAFDLEIISKFTKVTQMLLRSPMHALHPDSSVVDVLLCLSFALCARLSLLPFPLFLCRQQVLVVFSVGLLQC